MADLIRPTDWFVIDSRDENKVPQGPFNNEADARTMAESLSTFVFRFSPLGGIFPGAKVNGPFFAIPARAVKPHHRREINRLMVV
jgi:hypothetical protein